MNNRLLHTPEGVRDIYGKEYAKKLAIEQKLQQAIHCFGYEDIQTPSIEFFDVFSKEIGTTPSKELYKFFDKEGNTLVLRPDFTPSIARCAAKYFMEEKVPLRFSYNGNTFTNTSNLQGKSTCTTRIDIREYMNLIAVKGIRLDRLSIIGYIDLQISIKRAVRIIDNVIQYQINISF
jgi:ATP phosphoribosyltransferase regulatory subunit